MTLENLEILQLESNELTTIQGLAEGRTPSLEELLLSNNKLVNLHVLKMDKLRLINI